MCVNQVTKGKVMSGITIVPKQKKEEQDKRRVGKPPVKHYEARPMNQVKMFAAESFWEAWDKHHFDLSLIKAFYSKAPQLMENEEIIISDGKSVIVGRRTEQFKAVLTDGYNFKRVHDKKWVEDKGFIYEAQYAIRIGIDHRKHFIKRYRQRGFDLGLVAEFVSVVAQAKLGQRVKVVSKDDVLIGTRTTAHHAMLISGMKRGQIDMEDYVDWKF